MGRWPFAHRAGSENPIQTHASKWLEVGNQYDYITPAGRPNSCTAPRGRLEKRGGGELGGNRGTPCLCARCANVPSVFAAAQQSQGCAAPQLSGSATRRDAPTMKDTSQATQKHMLCAKQQMRRGTDASNETQQAKKLAQVVWRVVSAKTLRIQTALNGIWPLPLQPLVRVLWSAHWCV